MHWLAPSLTHSLVFPLTYWLLPYFICSSQKKERSIVTNNITCTISPLHWRTWSVVNCTRYIADCWLQLLTYNQVFCFNFINVFLPSLPFKCLVLKVVTLMPCIRLQPRTNSSTRLKESLAELMNSLRQTVTLPSIWQTPHWTSPRNNVSVKPM